jgi:hypothetical protein
MKKLLVVAGIVALLLLAYRVFFYEPCKEVDESLVGLVQLNCAMRLITPELRVEACRELGRQDECEFTEEDRPAINALINRKVNECAKQALAEEGYCTDKLPDVPQ